MAAGNQDSPDCQAALASLCQAYWLPLYSFVRRSGFSVEDAQDLTQAFFENVLQRDYLARADQARGRFRTFLLTSLQNFVRNERIRAGAQKRGGGQTILSWDALEAESRYAAEPLDHASPDQVFDRRWARTLMERALDGLVAEFSRTGRAELFHRLKVYLVSNRATDSYAELAEELGLTTGALKVTIHRLRQRYRELVRAEIAQTVADPTSVDDEMRQLAKFLLA